jgi:hypothetical protein
LRGLGESIASFKEHLFLYLEENPLKKGLKWSRRKKKKRLG